MNLDKEKSDHIKNFHILTLFPELFPGVLDVSIFKKSIGVLWNYQTYNLRDYGVGKHKKVDDAVFSGTPGMLIRADVVDNAIASINLDLSKSPSDSSDSSDLALHPFNRPCKRIFLTPRGKVLEQKRVEELAAADEDILLLCGRYEGVDQRAIDYFDFEEISIGKYILSGGEVAAMVLMESIIRKIDGVIGNKESFIGESFADDKISEPRYTRPAKWATHRGDELVVDDLWLCGDHEKIKQAASKRRKIVE